MSGTSPLPPCPACGFDGAALAPRDAAAALQSFPRRFAALVGGGSGDVPPVDADVRDAVAGEAGAALGAIAAAGEALRRVLITDDPTLTSAPATSTKTLSADEAFAELTAVVAPLAELALRTSGKAWQRTGWRDGQQVRALDLLREAVHAGAHHLRAAQRLPGVRSD